ncbi:MAG: HEAT repeat domain-containing protein [Bacillota bacterium]
MPLTYFCQNCWREIPAEDKSCPHCGARQDLESGYEEKLVKALDCPEAATAVRAAYILGKLGAVAAVPALIAKLESSEDPYLAATACEALAGIENPEARAAVRNALKHRFAPVRRAAEKYLR